MSSGHPAPRVAVCYSGWLAVRIPQRGATARRHLVDVLGADVVVAGTFLPTDACAASNVEPSARSACLLRRLHALRPVRTRIDPMLTIDDLHRLVTRSPNWPAVSSGFKRERTFGGVSIWAPLLGDRNLSVLRELHDYSRGIRLVGELEGIQGWRYDRVCFSRLEYHWLAPHPPMSVLRRGVVWLPSGGTSGGLNDRHALMDRAAADVYFRRWELLFSPNLLQRLPRRVVLRDGPEQFLREQLRVAGLRVRYFPATMALACCGRAARCFLGHAACVTHRVHLRAGPRAISAKYLDELKFAERHAAALGCPGAGYEMAAAADDDNGRREAGSREAAVVIRVPVPRLHRWHPQHSTAHSLRLPVGRAMLRRWAEHAPAGFSVPVYTTFVQLSRSASQRAPASSLAERWPAEAPLHTLRWQPSASAAADPRTGRGDTDGDGRPGRPAMLSTTVPSAFANGTARRAAVERVAHCPTLPRNWWPEGAVGGYCEPD